MAFIFAQLHILPFRNLPKKTLLQISFGHIVHKGYGNQCRGTNQDHGREQMTVSNQGIERLGFVAFWWLEAFGHGYKVLARKEANLRWV